MQGGPKGFRGHQPHEGGCLLATPPGFSDPDRCPAGRDTTPSAQALGRISSQIKAEAQRGAEAVARSPSPDPTPKCHTRNASLISRRASVPPPPPGAVHQRSPVALPRSWHGAPSSSPGGAPQTLYRETRAVRGASREMRLGHNSRTPPQCPEPASRGRQPTPGTLLVPQLPRGGKRRWGRRNTCELPGVAPTLWPPGAARPPGSPGQLGPVLPAD